MRACAGRIFEFPQAQKELVLHCCWVVLCLMAVVHRGCKGEARRGSRHANQQSRSKVGPRQGLSSNILPRTRPTLNTHHSVVFGREAVMDESFGSPVDETTAPSTCFGPGDSKRRYPPPSAQPFSPFRSVLFTTRWLESSTRFSLHGHCLLIVRAAAGATTSTFSSARITARVVQPQCIRARTDQPPVARGSFCRLHG